MIPELNERHLADWVSGAPMNCLVCGESMPEGDDCPSDHYGLFDTIRNNGDESSDYEIIQRIKEMPDQ